MAFKHLSGKQESLKCMRTLTNYTYLTPFLAYICDIYACIFNVKKEKMYYNTSEMASNEEKKIMK